MRDWEADRKLCAAATPGPWRACVWDPMERPHVHKDAFDQTRCECHSDLPITLADAAFIAAAREGWPAALEEVKRLRLVLAWFADRDLWTEREMTCFEMCVNARDTLKEADDGVE